jgi:hypothetical protein
VKEDGVSEIRMEKTRLELRCPACGKTRGVDMERADSFVSALLGAVGGDYLLLGSFARDCGADVIASLQVTALGRETKGGEPAAGAA